MSKKIIIFGGTFNPIHYGHLFLTEEALTILKYDRIILIPTNIPAHKSSIDLVEVKHRLAMLKMAVKGYKIIFIDDCEIKRGGISYMIDTLMYIKKEYKLIEKPALVIGDDLVNSFNKWKDAEKIPDHADIIIAHRKYIKELKIDIKHRYIDNKILSISSSEIRERIRKKMSIRFLLPEEVYEYIKKNNLYKE